MWSRPKISCLLLAQTDNSTQLKDAEMQETWQHKPAQRRMYLMRHSAIIIQHSLLLLMISVSCHNEQATCITAQMIFYTNEQRCHLNFNIVFTLAGKM